MKHKFYVDKTWKGNYKEDIHFEGTIELDDAVFNNVDDSWRKLFYDFNSLQQVVDHISFNMIVNDLTLSKIDGFANLSDDMAILFCGIYGMITEHKASHSHENLNQTVSRL